MVVPTSNIKTKLRRNDSLVDNVNDAFVELAKLQGYYSDEIIQAKSRLQHTRKDDIMGIQRQKDTIVLCSSYVEELDYIIRMLRGMMDK